MSSVEEIPESVSRKRKFENEETEEENDSKKFQALEPMPNLLDLADEVLVEILMKLDGESLHNLALTCTQLKMLTQEKKLWNQAIFTSRELDIWEIMKRLRYLLVNTKTLRIQGDCKKEKIEGRPLPNRQTFKTIINKIVERSPLIENLCFSQICFDWTKDFSISRFPANLRSLSFKNCIMPRPRSYRDGRTFRGIVEHMPNLEELRLEYCNFFESNELMPFSKIKELKILSLRGCSKMRNCVPYLSLACRFGFTKLEILDLRETNISDGELQCLNAVKTLKQLFLEHPVAEQPNFDSDDDDDDFSLFLRGPRRPTGRPPVLHPRPSAPQEPQPSTAPDPLPPTATAPLPSTAADPLPTTTAAPMLSTTAASLPSTAEDPLPSTAADPLPSTTAAPMLSTAAASLLSTPAAPLPSFAAAPLPSTSANTEPRPSLDEAPSSPESFSDSVSSSSSGPDESRMQAIVIRANINSDANPNEPRIQVIFGGDVPHASRYLQFGRNQEHRSPLSVSDRGMLGFGVPRPNLIGNLIFFGNQPTDPNTYLERIILRNFRNITDITLHHFETNAPRLSFLDIRGCNQISREAVERFRAARTDCELLSNYENEE